MVGKRVASRREDREVVRISVEEVEDGLVRLSLVLVLNQVQARMVADELGRILADEVVEKVMGTGATTKAT